MSQRIPIRYLSERQKRRLKQQVVKGLQDSLKACDVISRSPPCSYSNNQNNRSRLCSDTCLNQQNISKTDHSISPDFVADDFEICFQNDSPEEIQGCSSTESTLETLSVNQQLIQDLREWVVDCHIPLSHASKLLHILNKHKINVPQDARTLLKTPRYVEIIKISPGEYSHIGIHTGILKHLQRLNISEIPAEIKININIDGLPLSRSSGSQFWPILGCFVNENLKKFKPFVIGLYHGSSKPQSANEFLNPLVNECLNLQKNGIIWSDRKIIFKLNALICDAPAKAFVTYIKGHSGYHSCTKCIQDGNLINNRMTYQELGNDLRTDETFKLKIDEDHHLGTSVLEKLDFGMVSQVPLDYMHLVCLGVMKRLLQFWHKGKQDVRIPSRKFEDICELLLSFKKYIPKEFCRKPRSLIDIDRFKATEFRQFLLYTGLVVLKDLLSDDMYEHFLLLSCAIRILTTPNLCIVMNTDAQRLLKDFIIDYGEIYGYEYVTHNVHNLSHLCSDVLKFGCLDNFSAFPAESFMFHIKQKICLHSGKPLQQLVKRINEETIKSTNPNCFNNIIIKKQNSVEIQMKTFVLSNQEPDNCCLIKSGDYMIISEICQKSTNVFVKGQIFKSVGNIFAEPMDSRMLGIHLCTINNSLVVADINDVICKVICLPYKDNFVVLPLIHTNEIAP